MASGRILSILACNSSFFIYNQMKYYTGYVDYTGYTVKRCKTIDRLDSIYYYYYCCYYYYLLYYIYSTSRCISGPCHSAVRHLECRRLGCVRWIETTSHATRHHGSEGAEHPLRSVVTPHGNSIKGLVPQLNEPRLNITQPLGIWSINVYNGYYKVMSNIPKMGHLPTLGWNHSANVNKNMWMLICWCKVLHIMKVHHCVNWNLLNLIWHCQTR